MTYYSPWSTKFSQTFSNSTMAQYLALKIKSMILLYPRFSHLTFTLKEQLAIVIPSAKKSQLTMAPLNPKHANAPRINPQGKAKIRIAPTLALSSSGGKRRSHFNSWSFKTNTPRWFVCNLSICLRNTSVQNSLQRNFTASN